MNPRAKVLKISAKTQKDQRNTVTLTDNRTGKAFELPILEGAEGPSVVDIRALYSQTGLFTYDPGFTSTGSCNSAITLSTAKPGFSCTAAIASKP
jgi:citrate synthase